VVVGVVVFVLLILLLSCCPTASCCCSDGNTSTTRELIAIARETMMVISVNAVVRSIRDLLLLLLFEVLLFA
jgi:hypothetical protein